eukprot:scaffold6253_cov162-Pinguiococcus_pyrenoidosus.AAC.3
MKHRRAPRGQASHAVDKANFIGNLYCTPSGRKRRRMAFLDATAAMENQKAFASDTSDEGPEQDL